MAHSTRDVREGNSRMGYDHKVRAAIVAAIEGDSLTPEERGRRMEEGLQRCDALRGRLLKLMREPLPSGWSAEMIREGRP